VKKQSCGGSIVGLADVTQFATYSSFTQTLDYVRSDTPPFKIPLVRKQRLVVRCGWTTLNVTRRMTFASTL